MRTIVRLVAAIPALVACSAGTSGSRAESYARDGALAVRMGQRCADELRALARLNPESVFRALEADVSRAASKHGVRARVRAELGRRVALLSSAGAFAAREGTRAAAGAAQARVVADRLCQARNMGYTLARVSRPAPALSREAFAADGRGGGPAAP